MSGGTEHMVDRYRMSATGAVNRDLSARAELERRYRLLLRVYPGGYRRVHGDDILAVLMDTAEPGRRRPAVADVADLTRGALRQWFRLPLGVLPVVAAVLASLVLAAIGAAGGSWLAWQTAARLPSDAAAVQIGTTVAGAPLTAPTIDRRDGARALWRDVSVFAEPRLSGWSFEAAQGRLRADGWTTGRVQATDTHAYAEDTRLDGVHRVFEATRDGHVLKGYATTITTPAYAGTHLTISVSPAEPVAAPAAVAAGLLVGAITGWILTGWAAYRLRRRALPRRVAASILALTAAGLAAHPTVGLYRTLGDILFTRIDIYGIAPPYRWVTGSPVTWLVAGTLAAGLAILLLAATGQDRSRTDAVPTA